MMFIFLILVLINPSRSSEWNCTANKHILASNEQPAEQCTILIEYISLHQDKQACTTHTLSVKNLPLLSFSANHTMRIFRIHACQLLTLSQLPFTLPSSLEILDLSYNLLATFTLSYPLPFHLKYLYLDHNPNLRDVRFGHPQVQQQLIGLSLRHNRHLQLSSLPVNLVHLDLTGCDLDQSPILSLLRPLRKLTHLSLADNHLARLPALDRSVELEFLNLSKNDFTTVEEEWLHKSLHVLDLGFNQIQSLAFLQERWKMNQTLKVNTHHQTLAAYPLQLVLQGNPLVCDCWLSALLNSSAVNITDLSLLRCGWRAVVDLPAADLQCSYTRHCAPDCSCCDFEACDCHSVCPSECLCSHDALWSRHLVECRRANLSDIHLLLPQTMTELNYEENQLEQIRPFAFVGKTSLTKLNLAKNNIQYFANETFCAATNLREIDLSYNDNLMPILSNMNDLFGCLKELRLVILSNEQVNDGEAISYGWKVDQTDDILQIRRSKEPSQKAAPLDFAPVPTSTYPTFGSANAPSTIFSIFRQESFTTSTIIQHNQTLIVVVFFLLFFVLLFLLLLITLAICRRKLRRHITAELERQRSQHYYYHTTLHQPTNKAPQNPPANDSLYEQLPSLSSDSEQPFLYNDKKLNSSNAPALPPYPPSLRHYHCCHAANSHDYLASMKGYSSPNLQQQQSQPCQAVLIVGSQLIYPNQQDCLAELQQNLLLRQSENSNAHYCNNETVFVPTTLCRCLNQMKTTDTYISPSGHR